MAVKARLHRAKWVHTEQIGRLGWFDRWFCAPSNHRVHHAVNDAYLDRNYGGILPVWDRLFGSYQEEREACVYGTRSPLASWDPLWANAEVYWALAKDAWHARHVTDKLRVLFKLPGWRPADVAARFPKPAFEIGRLGRFDPQVGAAVRALALLQFCALLAGATFFLWHSELMPLAQSLVWLFGLAAGMCALGHALQGRIGLLDLLLIDAAILATAGAALGWRELHWLFKPLAMLVAIALVLRRSPPAASSASAASFTGWLLGALLASLAGDVLLMLSPGLFVPGLVAFLFAHLAYIRLFGLGVGLLPRLAPFVITLLIGTAMYLFLCTHGLPPALRLPVGIYVLAIAIMAAQAIARALVLRDPGAIWVAARPLLCRVQDPEDRDRASQLGVDHHVVAAHNRFSGSRNAASTIELRSLAQSRSFSSIWSTSLKAASGLSSAM